jgi:hypothetical protein
MKATLRMLVIVAVGAAIALALGAWLGLTMDDVRHIGQPRNLVRVGGEDLRIPAPTGPAARLLPAVPVTTTGEHAFMFDDPGGPVRYDPCRPLAWVLNPEGMPDGAEELVHQAVESVQLATGLQLEYQGTTSEVASFDRELIQDRYGTGFVPIIIGFATQSQDPDLEGTVTGIGGSSAVYAAYGEQQFLRSGTVVLDSEDIGIRLGTLGGSAMARAVVQHELGHVVGLGHVEDDTELMNALNTSMTDWGPGDLEGLAVLGAGPCEDY